MAATTKRVASAAGLLPPSAEKKRRDEDGDGAEPVSFEDISTAAFRIRSGIKETSCEKSPKLSELLKMSVYLKKDFRQASGSFKERGARNALMLLSEEQKKIGVIAASAGNHALGLACHGNRLGIPVTVVMPTVAPITKVQNCRDYGATVVISGNHILEAKEKALTIAQAEGLEYINGFDHPAIVAGQGSMGIEILSQVPELDAIVVPVGGAGLLAGICLSVKTLRPDVQVIGVESSACASFAAAMQAGEPVTVPVSPTLADGLAVPKVGANSFRLARGRVDKLVQVTERAIALSMLRLLELEKVVIEGGGAIGLAALLDGHLPELEGKNVAILLCGGNVDTPVLGRVIERGLAADGRLLKLEAKVSDRPGGIATLTKLIADIGVSIKDIYHERAWLEMDIASVHVKVVVETRDRAHGEELKELLVREGYVVRWGTAVRL